MDLNSKYKGFLDSNMSTGMNQSSLFLLDKITIRFGQFCALKDISLHIDKKDFIFITGPSGAGKTTLLRVLNEEIKPDSGKLLNYNLPEKGHVTSIFQDLRLITGMSVEKNLRLGYDPKAYSSQKKFETELIELSRVFGIKSRLREKIENLNGGGRQKVAIIRSLLSKPSVLLADEPTSSLDKDNASRLFEVLNYYNNKHDLTVIWATHSKDLIRNFSGKIVHLDHGKLIHTGNACFI